MTDARIRDRLPAAIRALPKGAGVVFRDGELAREVRRRHFRDVAALCARRRLVLLVAGPPVRGDWRAHGRHNSRRHDRPIRSLAVHDAAQAADARHRHVDLCLVSPVWPTQSHPDSRALGQFGFCRLARLCPGRIIALGGATRKKARRLRAFGAYGWAAIDGMSDLGHR